MSSILKSSDLIRTIKRRAFIPESQKTFLADDFLEMATEKVNINLMDQIMVARGDYLVYHTDVPLEQGVFEYTIPDRAHGNKLRDALIVDSKGNVVKELTQVSLEEISDVDSYDFYEPFYLQNNQVVLVNQNYRSSHFLRMYFYMRPNKLVLENRAAIVTQITKTFEVDTVTPLAGAITNIAIDGVVTAPNHGINSSEVIIISGTDSIPSIDGNRTVQVIDANSFRIIDETITVAGASGSWAVAAEVVVVPSVNFPKHFLNDITYDVVSAISPNKIKLYNLQANTVNNSAKTLSFRVKDTGTSIIKGDYITKAEETIVPNVPTEYHPVLAQMVAVSFLESQGDEQQKQSANNTLKEMQAAVLRIVSNRVEGAPKKIKNRNGTLAHVLDSRKRRG